MADAATSTNRDSDERAGGSFPLPLVLIALFGVALRVFHVFQGEASPYAQAPIMDARYHLDWARALAAGVDFQSEAYFRAPLYPGFLGLLHRLLGENLMAWRLVQCFLGGITILLTGLIARRVFGRPQALFAALIMAVAWVPLHFDTLLLIPVLFLPLVLGALLRTLSIKSKPTGKVAFVAGALWGLATITRPSVLLLAPLYFWWVKSQKKARAGWVLALLFTAGWLLPVVPVTLRNRIVGGEWTLVATQAGVNLWIGNNPQSDGVTAIVPGTRGGWWEGHLDARRQAEAAAGKALSPGGVSAHYSKRTLDWLTEDPGAFLGHLLYKTRLFFSSRELGNNLEPLFFATHYDPLTCPWVLPFGALLGLALVGAFLARKQALLQGPLFAFVPVYAAGVIAFFVCSRFRLPVWPVMAAFASHGAWVGCCALLRRDALQAGKIFIPALGIWALSVWITPSNLFTPESIGEMQLGDAALESGNHGLAAEHYALATSQERVSPHAHLGLARSLMAVGKLVKAQQILDELVALGNLPEAREDRVRLAIMGGRSDEALLLGAEFAQRFGLNPGVLFQQGRAHYAKGDYARAQRVFGEVLGLDPRHGGAAFSLARSLDAQQLDSLDAWVTAVDLYLTLGNGEPFVAQAFERALQQARAQKRQALVQRLEADLHRWTRKNARD